MLTRPLTSSVSVISAITLTLGAAVLPGVALGSLPIASAAPTCPAADAPTLNAGTYELSTPAHLQWVKENSGSWADDFLLTGNIDMTGCTWDAGIGNESTPYTGTFDGGGLTISGLTVSMSGAVTGSYGAAGLFGVLGAGSDIHDLTVKGSVSASASGGSNPLTYAGGIAGKSIGATLTNVSFVGTVTAIGVSNHPYAGGILGEGTATMTGVSSIASVSASPIGRASAGGLAGTLNFSVVRDSWSAGSVYASGDVESRAAGLIGTATDPTLERTFSNSSVTAANTGFEQTAGGLLGRVQGVVTISDSYAMGGIQAPNSGFIGGLVGWLNNGSSNVTVTDSYYSGVIGEVGADELGGLVGKSEQSPVALSATFWDVDVTGTNDAIGASATATGATGETTMNMTAAQTFQAASWNITDGYSNATIWSICPGYNDGYPFLGTLVGSDPCSTPAPTMSPVTQALPTTLGATVQTQQFSVSFSDPFYSVSPGLPAGLSMDTTTGVITGAIGGQPPATYTVSATSTSLPLQTATSTITQSAALKFPRQISDFTVNTPDNGAFQTVADGPADGTSLLLTYAVIEVNGTATESYYTYVLDRDGNVLHGPTNILPAAFTTSSYVQPSAAFNPITGGWLACYSQKLADPTSQSYCQYLNVDGSAAGNPFPIADPFTDQWNQNAIAYSDDSEAFLVAATSYGDGNFSGPIGRFVDANGTGAIGNVIDFQSGVGFRQNGGLDLAYSPTSKTYGLVSRGKLPTDPEAAPFFFHLDSSGVPTQAPQRLTNDTSQRMTNGSIAYDATADQFMVVAFDQMNAPAGPLVAQGYDASTGATRGASPTLTTISMTDFSNWGWRPTIAAHDESSEFMVVTPMTPTSTAVRGIYAMRLDGDGAASPPTLVPDQMQATSGYRPRVTFNNVTCEYLSTYNTNAPGWNWQLFSGSIPTSAPCTPTTPSAPLNANVTAGDAKASVTWQLPNSAGTSAITSYQVTATPGGATCSATAPALTCEVTGLSNGTSYTFEVRAQNNSGWGPYSQPSNAVTPTGGSGPGPGPAPSPTPSTPPSAPLNVTATAGDATAAVTWQAPASPGSSAITAYQVTSTPGGGTCLASAPALTCEVTGLSNGTSYTFTVRALNSAGWSEASAPSNAVTPTAPVEQAIVITGFRANDGKGRRIVVDGSTTGMSGMSVTPHFRFPGRSDYRAGVLSLPIDDKGAFRWSRSTSRKIFVYFDGGGVRSNTIVIAAR